MDDGTGCEEDAKVPFVEERAREDADAKLEPDLYRASEENDSASTLPSSETQYSQP